MTHPDRFLLAGVMGWPIMHSRSPQLHNYWLSRHGLAGSYLALEIVDRVDPLARRIGAVNCVVVADDGSLEGRNTDAFGYIECVREAQPGWRADAGPIVVIGAGGGARAVLVSLIDQGAREIRLVNRSSARANALAR